VTLRAILCAGVVIRRRRDLASAVVAPPLAPLALQ
jgi:hypothetical protein